MSQTARRALRPLASMLVILGVTLIFNVVASPIQSVTLRHTKMASNTTTIEVSGYTQVAADGGIFNFGTSQFYGSMGGHPLNKPIVAMAADPATGGYWEVATDGGIFSFNAPFFGSMGGKPLNQPIVGMASTPDGGGYWLVAADGGIFTFGNAAFYGSMGGHPLNKPIVAMAADPATGGYWEVASDGGIFSFNAPFFGSMGGKPLNQPIVGMAPVNPSSTLLPAGANGYDLSNYQCSDYTSATGGAFYILGVSGGPFFNNTCVQQEGAFGGSASQGYLFLGNTVSAPPGTPPAPSCPNSISETLCPSYQLGYQQAESSYQWAASQGVYPAMWWLDIESNNCSVFGPTGQWMQAPGQSCGSTLYNTSANAATVQGALAALNVPGKEVGIYSTPIDWQQITGDLNLPYGTSLWEPIQQGASCANTTGFGGGIVAIVQYQTTGTFDQDIAC